MNLDTAFTAKLANKETDTFNKRGAAETKNAENPDDLEQQQFYSKLRQMNVTVNDSVVFMEEEKVGGAYYLPVLKDVTEAWKVIVSSLQSLNSCDVSLQEASDFNAHGIQYFHDTFSLARTRICKLENEQGHFLEIRRLEGDGFVFADLFKKNLTENIMNADPEAVKDVETVEPIPSENLKDPSLNFLDLHSDEASSMEMIQHWLQTLKPRGGVKYDTRNVLATLQALGWNCNEPKNFEVLSEYSEHIVGPVLNVLLAEETTFVPSAYFGVMCLDKFVQGDAIPDELKSWETVQSLLEIVRKFCITEKSTGLGEVQVTRSREVLRLLSNTLQTFVPKLGEVPSAFVEKAAPVVQQLEAAWGSDLVASVKQILLPKEEEVEAAQ